MAAKPKVVLLLTEELHKEFMVPEVEEALSAFEVVHAPQARTEDELISVLQGAAGCITSWRSPRLTAKVIERSESLRIIGHSAGSVKDFVDILAWDRNIVVINAAHVIARYVGEMALLFTLAALRNLPQNDRMLREGVQWKPNKWTHTDTLFGKTVGLVGFGATGREFANLLGPFGTKLLVYDPYIDRARVEEYGGELVSLETLLQRADIVSLHAPAIVANKGMIGAKELAMMKDGAILVNTARGALIDEEALLAELQKGRIKAALDVYEREPLALDHPFRKAEHAIITPHISGPVMTERWRMLKAIADDFRRYLIDNEPLKRTVSRESLETGA